MDIERTRERLLSNSRLAPDGCRIWTGEQRSKRKLYGAIRVGGRNWLAHRASYLVFKGPIPPGHVVRHICHNPKCINPEHLETGTAKQNVADQIQRGTFYQWKAPAGERNPSAKLTESQVLEIRKDPRSSEAVARDYGVSGWTVRAIRSRRKWQHI